MQLTLHTPQHTEPEPEEPRPHPGVIRDQVLHALGRPTDLYTVQVRRLWGEYYRVNVLVGPDAVSARIAHSYFLTVDDDGKVVASNPRVTREHPPRVERAADTGPAV
jgi:hypothetical protein